VGQRVVLIVAEEFSDEGASVRLRSDLQSLQRDRDKPLFVEIMFNIRVKIRKHLQDKVLRPT